jgi:hypothetical protein
LDRNISALTALCAVLWTVGAAFVTLTLIYPNRGLGQLGIFVTAMAVVTQIHGMFRALVRREECAYHLGVAVGSIGRVPGKEVRRLR